MDGFECGDKVMLKSGGPVMTVEEVSTYMGGEAGVKCVWFDAKGATQHRVFKPGMLEPVTDD